MTCNEVSVDLTRGDISAKGRQMRDVNLIRLKQQISSGNFIGTVLPRSIAPRFITKILLCPDFPHEKYPVILPNSATAIRHRFSDTKVVKPI